VTLSNLLRTLAFSAATVLWAGSASAVTFGGGYAVTLHTSTSDGTALSKSDVAATPFNFDLIDPGNSTGFDLFKITIAENIDETDDFDSNPISVAFAFTLPDNVGGTITGTTTGVVVPVITDFGLYNRTQLNVTWDHPIDVDFSGIVLRITLSDIEILCSKTGTCEGKNGNVYATFLLSDLPPPQIFTAAGVEGAVANPLPAALPMFATGLGLVGGLGYWRRRKAKGRAA
jgi:hypothetical protein